MPTFLIDADRTAMIATGAITPVLEWIEGSPRGAERPVKRCPLTGFPLWQVHALVADDDDSRPVVAAVELPSMDRPAVAKLRPVVFEDLRVDAYVQRSSGALVCRWSASGIASNGKSAAVAS